MCPRNREAKSSWTSWIPWVITGGAVLWAVDDHRNNRKSRSSPGPSVTTLPPGPGVVTLPPSQGVTTPSVGPGVATLPPTGPGVTTW